VLTGQHAGAALTRLSSCCKMPDFIAHDCGGILSAYDAKYDSDGAV